MVERFMNRLFRETRGIHEAAYLLALFALFSQLLALLRDRLLAASFGAGETLDLYYAAFRIPDFLFVVLASLFSLYALLPVLSHLEREHPGLAVSFLRKTLLVFFVGLSAVSGIAFLWAPELVRLALPGLGESQELILLTRILLLQPLLLGASNILANLTQLRHRFLLYSISPLLYNLGIILGLVAFYPYMGLSGLAWGVVLGAALHALVQVPFFSREGRGEPLPWRRYLPQLREALLLSIPRTLALSASQISLMIIVALASVLSAGSISVFTFAWNLQAVPLTIIGVSYSVAAFPTLARLFAEGKQDVFRGHIESAFRHVIFWAVPATALIIVLRAHIVRAVLGAGAFDWGATRLTAAALAIFALALLAQSGSLLIARAYYAAGKTIRPFVYALVDVGVSVLSAAGLAVVFQQSAFFHALIESLLRVEEVPGTTVLMLALGLALGSVAKFLVGFFFFARDFSLVSRLGRILFESFAAAVIGGSMAYQTLHFFGPLLDTTNTLGILLQGFVAGVIGITSVGIVLGLLKSKELMEVIEALRRRLPGVREVVVEPTDISSVQ